MAYDAGQGMQYNEGQDPTSVGLQLRDFYYSKVALIDARKKQVFIPLSNSIIMPRHYGKKIKRYHYVPLLDDRNVNDQGIDATGAVSANGNLWGSSKDIGAITGKLPSLHETSGRVNRVGYTRIEIEGTMENFGFFDEYTEDVTMFDTDEQLMQRIHTEMLNGASEISEVLLQKDLLNNAGVVLYSGVATQDSEITGEGDNVSEVDYKSLMQLDKVLTDNRTPRETTMLTGSRLTDTRTIGSTRIIHTGNDMLATFKYMTDAFGNKAFIEAHHYADQTNLIEGEVGSVGDFRIVIVPEMKMWASKGGAETGANKGYQATAGKYDIFPLLCIGDKSFATIGFQNDGKNPKYRIIHKKPGKETATASNPYGKKGFKSIQWWYGFFLERGERIGLIKSVARI